VIQWIIIPIAIDYWVATETPNKPAIKTYIGVFWSCVNYKKFLKKIMTFKIKCLCAVKRVSSVVAFSTSL